MKLLSTANPKIQKGTKLGYLSFILHLAPADLSGKETCPKRTAGCTAACLNTAGRGGMSCVICYSIIVVVMVAGACTKGAEANKDANVVVSMDEFANAKNVQKQVELEKEILKNVWSAPDLQACFC